MGIINQFRKQVVTNAPSQKSCRTACNMGVIGVDKIFWKSQRGGFLLPMDKIAQLINYKHLLTTEQKTDIVNALQTAVDWLSDRQKHRAVDF